MGFLRNKIEEKYEKMIHNNVLLTENVFKCKEPKEEFDNFSLNIDKFELQTVKH